MSKLLFRIAPTPSGFLHLGNVFNFLLNWLYARQLGAAVLLRIDDLDAVRSRVEYLEDIFDTLHWIGLDWDLGPRNISDFQQNWSQTLRSLRYHEQLEKLIAQDQIFACNCTRKSLRERGYSNAYPGICAEKNLPLDAALPWRVRVLEGTLISFSDVKNGLHIVDLSESLGSFVVKTREGVPAYQLASLCDDVHFGVTHIIRGQDLLVSTAAQLHLGHLLGLEPFKNIQFYHHPLITDAAGAKLSKSANSLSLQSLRSNHYTPTDLFYEFASWMNLPIKEKIEKAEVLIPFLSPFLYKL